MISSLIARNICTIRKIGTQSNVFHKMIQCRCEKSGVFSGITILRNNIRSYGIFNSTSQFRRGMRNSIIIPETGNRQLSTEQVSKMTRPYEVNTNVANNVILYKYENNRFYKLFSVFAFSQLIGWSLISYYIYTSYCAHMFHQDNWMNNMMEYPLSFALLICSLLLGVMSYGIIHFLITRSIKYVILCKGGRQFMIVTYHPTKQTSVKTVPLESVSVNIGRKQASSATALKIKGNLFYYLMDVRGVYTNQELFNFTAGIKR